MSETGWRLTLGCVLSIAWFAILGGVTDWHQALVFLAAVILGFTMSVIDLIILALLHVVFD